MNGPPTAHHELNPRWCLAHDTIDCRDIDHLIQWLSTYPRLTKGAITRDLSRVGQAGWPDPIPCIAIQAIRPMS